MHARMFFADAAVSHGDGTITIVRGGITKAFISEGAPRVFSGAFVVQLSLSEQDAGKHTVSIEIKDSEGNPLEQKFVHELEAKPSQSEFNLILNLPGLTFPALGDCSFDVDIDNKAVKSVKLSVIQKPKGGE